MQDGAEKRARLTRGWRMERAIRALAAGLLASPAPAALAQAVETAPEAVTVSEAPAVAMQVYEPPFFTRFAPVTALDMVVQIPGFSLTGGDDEKRGFGQGGANALINGRRTSGKANGTIEALARVPAHSVLRIEIVDGASLSLPGLSGQVANVITRQTGLTGRYKWNPQLRSDTSPVILRGDISVSGEGDGFAWTVGAGVDQSRGQHAGPERVVGANGDLLDLRDEKGGGGGSEPGFNASFSWTPLNGNVLNLNATAAAGDFRDKEISQRSGAGLPDRYRLFASDYEDVEGEIGVDYEFGLWGGRLKLIGLMSQEDGKEHGMVTETYADLRPAEGGEFITDFTSGERIVRAEYAFGGTGEWQAAVEGAFNFLDLTNTGAELDLTGAFIPFGPPERTRVEERRAEASVTWTRTLIDGLDLQATLAGEYSELSQTGLAENSRDFVRPKGFISLAWEPAPDTDMNIRIEREVGQLDFGDFAASTDLEDETGQSGNADLVPEQAWTINAELNRRLGKWGAVKLSAFASAIEDSVDLAPVYFCDDVRVASPAACAAPGVIKSGEIVGNIDKAERYGLTFSGTVNFDPLGWEGARLEFSASLQESLVIDPFTGRERRLSETDISDIDVSFRWDAPGTSWAFGAGHEGGLEGAYYGLNERGQGHVRPGYTFYFVENKDVFGAKVWFQYLPSGPRETFYRNVYEDGRGGPLSYTEDRVRRFGDIFRLEITGSF